MQYMFLYLGETAMADTEDGLNNLTGDCSLLLHCQTLRRGLSLGADSNQSWKRKCVLNKQRHAYTRL